MDSYEDSSRFLWSAYATFQSIKICTHCATAKDSRSSKMFFCLVASHTCPRLSPCWWQIGFQLPGHLNELLSTKYSAFIEKGASMAFFSTPKSQNLICELHCTKQHMLLLKLDVCKGISIKSNGHIWWRFGRQWILDPNGEVGRTLYFIWQAQ